MLGFFSSFFFGAPSSSQSTQEVESSSPEDEFSKRRKLTNIDNNPGHHFVRTVGFDASKPRADVERKRSRSADSYQSRRSNSSVATMMHVARMERDKYANPLRAAKVLALPDSRIAEKDSFSYYRKMLQEIEAQSAESLRQDSVAVQQQLQQTKSDLPPAAAIPPALSSSSSEPLIAAKSLEIAIAKDGVKSSELGQKLNFEHEPMPLPVLSVPDAQESSSSTSSSSLPTEIPSMEWVESRFASVLSIRERSRLYDIDNKLLLESVTASVLTELITELVKSLLVDVVSESIDEFGPEVLLDGALRDLLLDEIVKYQKDLPAPFTQQDTRDLEYIFDLNEGGKQKLLIGKFGLQINRDKILCLREGEWLNDEVINFYFEMMNDRELRQNHLPKCHFYNTFLYAKLMENGKYEYANVRRWTKKVDIFSLDKAILPVHLGVHWTLCVVNMRDKRFEYYDSMGGVETGKRVVSNVKKYLEDECMDKKKCSFPTDDWEIFIPSSEKLPQQENSNDCGMFCCKFANLCAQDLPLTLVQQRDMPHYRKRMALEIYRGEIL